MIADKFDDGCHTAQTAKDCTVAHFAACRCCQSREVIGLTTQGVRRWPVRVCKHLPVLTHITLTVWSPLQANSRMSTSI